MKTMWHVVKAPTGKYAKVRTSNLKLIPKSWNILLRGSTRRLYKHDGSLSTRAEGLMTIKNHLHVKELETSHYYDTGILIGKIVGK